MPCSEGMPSDNSEYIKIKKLTAILCSDCRVLTRLKYDFDENPMLSEWWEEHKKDDKTNHP